MKSKDMAQLRHSPTNKTAHRIRSLVEAPPDFRIVKSVNVMHPDCLPVDIGQILDRRLNHYGDLIF